ncbi:MAG TPA: TerC family protein [Cytophagaceae bacterium]|jgi:tellurite resistance protein TerC|nr:TerC family protein [Cytophagaceae bacterium]
MDDLRFWIIFNVFVLTMLVLDLYILNSKSKVVKIKEALAWSAFWIGLAGAFNLFVWYWKGEEPALKFLAGYLLEESLSVDNLFVFMLIFSFFKVPNEYQRKVLFWGIIGALVLRALFILVGVELIHHFHITMLILGGFLVYTGIRMLIPSDKEIDPKNNPIVKIVNKIMPVTRSYHGDSFFVKAKGIWFATPLFIVVLVTETTDVVFAMDSIPAILSITDDAFIVYTSNVFALLGLRSLYFALAGIMQLFHYLHYGLSFILIFIGCKMMIKWKWDYEIPIEIALSVVGGILILSILISILLPKKDSVIPVAEKESEKVK